ncbi:MAG: hypothetical protein IPG02_12495 [Ignavibacteria bacterium]|nr:hypothetical protein [Ignavibacteria bacterium]
MIKLIIKIFLLLLVVAGTLFLILRRSGSKVYDSNNYFAAIIDKDSLIMNTASPRIIFAGASNLAFGLDSKMIEKEFGMPVINMGLHGNFGLSFILNNVKKNIREGDIIILSLEYYLDELYYKDIDYITHLYPKAEEYIDRDGDYYSQKAKYFVSEAQAGKQKLFNQFFDKVLKFKEAKVFVSDQLHSYDTLIYSRNAFNSNGDVVSHIGKKYPDEIRGRTLIEAKDYSESIKKLNDFAEYVKAHGARVYFTYASYPETEFKKNILAIEEFEKQLKDDMKIEIITTPQEMMFSDSLFFDTVYHLNEEGRRERTEILIEKMKEKKIVN